MRASWLCFNKTNLLTRLLGVVLCSVASAGHAASPSLDQAGLTLVSADLLTMPVSNLGKLIQVEEVCEEGDLMAGTAESIPALALSAQAAAPANRTKSAAAPAAKPAQQPAAAAPVAAPAATQAPMQTSWEIALADKTLNAALARWAIQAGWQLVWDIPVDYAVETRTTVPGTFVEAVTLVTKSMATAEIPMKAIFYDGNKVLRIVSKGAE